MLRAASALLIDDSDAGKRLKSIEADTRGDTTNCPVWSDFHHASAFTAVPEPSPFARPWSRGITFGFTV
jgi:hypothetical protein